MADCSYARCIQERRFVKRELQKWTKNMVYIVGLERVAEELMGRRKWKQYQDIIQRSNLNLDATNLTQKITSPVVNNGHHNHHHNNQEEEEEEEKKLLLQKLEISKEDEQENTLINHIKSETLLTENNNQEKEINKKLSTETENVDSEIKVKSDTDAIENSENNQKDDSIKLKTEEHEGENKEDISLPVDWKPQDKCYFCVDGKLLTVNESGELVAESGPVRNTEADLTNNRTHDSDSDSSESEQDQSRKQLEQANKQLTAAFLRQAQGLGTNMTSFENMAAQLAAVASLHGLQPGLAPFYPGLWYGLQQQAQQQDSPSSQTPRNNQPQASQSPSLTEPNASSSPVAKSGPPDLIAVGGEQPLDLSAKPSGSSSREPPPMLKAKPRIAPIPGRRSYTEEELQSALRDILSGKLGTRRAAVIYGIPRSTLRNKVYKFTMENRQQLPRPEAVLPAILAEDDDDNNDEGDDDLESQPISTPGSLSPEELIRLSSNPALTQVALQRLLLDTQKSGEANSPQQQQPQSQQTPPEPPKIPTPQTPSVISPMLDPNLLLQLQGLLLGGGLGALAPGLLTAKPEELAAIQKLMLSQQELFKEQLKQIQNQTSTSSRQEQNNGQDLNLLQNLSFLQQQQQQQLLQKQLRKSNATPDGVVSGGEMNDNSDPSMLLRIPSYKPVVAGSSNASKNGESPASSSLSHTSPSLRPVVPNSPLNHHLPVTSPPIIGRGGQRSESESPPTLLPTHKSMLSISEVIAKSISKNFQQHVEQQQQQQHTKMHHHHHHGLGLDLMEQYKRPSISVIKNLGSVDRFGQSSSLSPNSNTGTGGKGTRPKRGKYRNYDRDSLVEAVKAVQRGEMSVHRAGSYYGVPHSTLEYKVKERHLMRPRKREPKPQPLDGTSTTSASSSNKQSQDLSVMRAQLDKKPPLGKTPPFPATSPNGMKMPPMFDTAMASQLQYSSPFMWPHHPSFAGMPGLASAANSSNQQQQQPPTFPPNAEHLFAQHMMQRFQQQEENPTANRNGGGSSSSGSKTPNNGSTSGASTPASGKSTRELAESIYDASTNGSFLDGIIRHSLDKKPAEMNHGALFDQLVKNNRNSLDQPDHGPTNAAMVAASALLASQSATSTGRKRSGSPMSFAQTEIKRERASPDVSSDSDRPESGSDFTKETVNQLIKLQQGLPIKLEQKGKEDINGGNGNNGGTTSNDDDNIHNDDFS